MKAVGSMAWTPNGRSDPGSSPRPSSAPGSLIRRHVIRLAVAILEPRTALPLLYSLTTGLVNVRADAKAFGRFLPFSRPPPLGFGPFDFNDSALMQLENHVNHVVEYVRSRSPAAISAALGGGGKGPILRPRPAPRFSEGVLPSYSVPEYSLGAAARARQIDKSSIPPGR